MGAREKDVIEQLKPPPKPTVEECDALLRVLVRDLSGHHDPAHTHPIEVLKTLAIVCCSLHARVASLEATRLLTTKPRRKKAPQ